MSPTFYNSARGSFTPVALSLLILSAPAWPQALMGGVGTRIQLNNSDMAVLEAQEVRKDLPCTVEPVKPALGFDLRFHGVYDITFPMQDVAGS